MMRFFAQYNQRMEKNDLLTIESLSDELRGIAKVNGKTHFVRGALVGEQVRFVRTRRKRSWAEGYASELLVAHPERIMPACNKADALVDTHPCGGCSLQHMPLAMQRKEKQTMVARLLSPYTQPSAWQEALVADGFGYRQKARLGVRYNTKAYKVHVGFREARSHFIANSTHCPVLDKRIGEHLLSLANTIAQSSIPDAIAQIEVAMGDTECALVVRHLQPLTTSDQELLIALAQQHNWQLWLQPSNYQSAHRIYPNETPELLFYEHPDFAVRLFFHPLDFTQINASINRALVACAAHWLVLNKGDVLFDLFSGIGNFAIPLATKGADVHVFDNDAALLERCQTNADYNQVQLQSHCLDLFAEQGCERLAALLLEQVPRTLLVDPPRSGCEQLVRLVGAQPCVQTLLYVSCNPHTLARDANHLSICGFSIARVAIADMFPHTHHVETICLFIRK